MSDGSELKFIFAYVIFIGFVIQITSLGAPTFLAGNPSLNIPDTPNCTIGSGGWYDVPVIAQAKILVDLFSCAWDNFTFFFTLMSYSSTITILGGVLFVPFAIAIAWIITNWLRGR